MAAKGDNIDLAMAGVLPDVPDSSLRLMSDVAAWLRAKGISEGATRELLTDHKYTAAEYAAVKALKAQRLSDRDWTKRWLDGGLAESKDMTLMHIVLNFEESQF